MKSFVIQFIGFTAVVMGWIIAIIEFRHMYVNEHKFDPASWTYVLVFITVGALAIQTGEMTKSVEFIRSIRKPGGKRWYEKTEESPTRSNDDRSGS